MGAVKLRPCLHQFCLKTELSAKVLILAVNALSNILSELNKRK